MKIDVNSIPLGYCIFCLHEVYNTDKKFVLAMDRPHLNLWTHRACYNGRSHDEIVAFLRKNLPEYLNKYYEQENIGSNGKKKTEKIKRQRIKPTTDEITDTKHKTVKYRRASLPKV